MRGCLCSFLSPAPADDEDEDEEDEDLAERQARAGVAKDLAATRRPAGGGRIGNVKGHRVQRGESRSQRDDEDKEASNTSAAPGARNLGERERVSRSDSTAGGFTMLKNSWSIIAQDLSQDISALRGKRSGREAKRGAWSLGIGGGGVSSDEEDGLL